MNAASNSLLRILGVNPCKRIIMSRCRYPMCHRQATVIVRDLSLTSSGVYPKLVFCIDHAIEYLRKAARAGQPCDVELYVYEGIPDDERDKLRLYLEGLGVRWG